MVSKVAYDAVGRPLSITDPAGKQTKASYDAAGRLLPTVDASGRSTSYSYDGPPGVVTYFRAVTDRK